MVLFSRLMRTWFMYHSLVFLGQPKAKPFNPMIFRSLSSNRIWGTKNRCVLVESFIGIASPNIALTFLAHHPTQSEGDNTPPPACPICERTFTRTQERNRHLRSHLPHYIYCPFPGCPWRCDRHDNLRNHWKRKHADSGQAPQKQECEIYNPDSFVELVTCGQMSIEEAGNAALFEVILRAFEEGKQDLWSENWWGRRLQHRTAA